MLKTFLKNARSALDKKDNTYAISQCESALEIDPKSYNAYVFLGLANSNEGDFTKAESAYRQAIQIDESNLLAWQGMLSMFDKSGQLSKFIDASSRVAAIYADTDEEKCFKCLEKAVDLAKARGTALEQSQALKLILPISPFFHALQDRIPDAADTYQELCSILEDAESTRISTEIAKGRQRLGIKLDDLTAEVKNEVYLTSELEAIYIEIINWSHEEAVRREAERKLLAHAVDRLRVSKSVEKPDQLARVVNVARGMTIVKVPNELAWSIVLDWMDTNLCDLDMNMLSLFVSLFQRPLASALQAYIAYSRSENIDIAALINLLTDAYENDESILGQRLLIDCYVRTEQYEAAIDFAESLLEKVRALEESTSVELRRVKSANDIALATALTHHRTPRFHVRALDLLEGVIEQDQHNIVAILAKARILRIDGETKRARSLLESIDDPDDTTRFELAQCLLAQNEVEEALYYLQRLSESMTERTLLSAVHYQIGQCYKRQGDTKEYAAYIQALRYDQRNAPTYTALGLYYADTVNDPVRADKCFQKALELSPAEIVAAERLASNFADSKDWELVEIIAQRVIQGNEQLRVAWPYRAIGFVHLNVGKYQQAVSAFQSCLRLANDINAWIGLGEAYLELGRYQAAKKAFARAIKLEPGNWHAKYLAATVATSLGEHEAACSALQQLIRDDDAVSLKLSLCLAYQAWATSLLEENWVTKAVRIALDCLDVISSVKSDELTPSLIEVGGKIASMLTSCPVGDIADKFGWCAGLESKFDTDGNILVTSALKAFSHSIDYAETDADRAVLWYEMGRVLQQSDQATIAYKCAIKLQPENDTFWAALGSVSEPDVAQHCLIKATTLSPKSALHWTNLGYFYLEQNIEAANTAFMTAQTLDPTYALAWLGQAIIASTMGEHDHELFEHALKLSSPVIPAVALKYVESLVSSGRLDHSALLQIKRIVSPRMQLYIDYMMILDETSLQKCTELVDRLEERYENDESDETLAQYCDAKSVLARIQLRNKDYDGAIETATSVIELEPEGPSLLSCRLVVAVASHLLGIDEDLDTDDMDAKCIKARMLHKHDADAAIAMLPAQANTLRAAMLAKSSPDKALTALLEPNNLIERAIGVSIQAQLHMHPDNADLWLELAQTNDPRITAMAKSLSANDSLLLARACRASNELNDRLISLHLDPQAY